MNLNKKIAIIIVNWKQYELTINCLLSLEKLEYKNFKVIIVDNESNFEKILKPFTLPEKHGNVPENILLNTTNAVNEKVNEGLKRVSEIKQKENIMSKSKYNYVGKQKRKQKNHQKKQWTESKDVLKYSTR